jgi:hypothetical protein
MDKTQKFKADYLIDHKNGAIPLGELSIGARVADPSWEWEFRTGENYSGSGDVKPVTWIIVAKNHYKVKPSFFKKGESHVTLLAEELIGKHAFDNSTNRSHEYAKYGYSHWSESGSGNATRGLRPWLNSTPIHGSEGFYRAFSKVFKRAVIATTVPNREWKNGTAYITTDYVFIPSTTELGDSAHNLTYPFGSVYPFFSGANDAKRVALLGGEADSYWTRSPGSFYGYVLRCVNRDGVFYCTSHANFRSSLGVRPAVNLKSDTLVSEIRGLGRN